MITIEGLQALPFQKFQMMQGKFTIYFTLSYRPAIQMWFLDFEYQEIIVKGLRVYKSENLLSQWSKIIDFGLLVYIADNIDPMYINDFSTNRVILNLLEASDLAIIETTLRG